MLYLVKRSLRGKIFRKICKGIAFHLHGCGTPGETGGGGGVDTGGVIHEIGGKGRILDLGILQIPGKLMDDGPHDLQVAQLLGADVRQEALQLIKGHRIPLGEIAQ